MVAGVEITRNASRMSRTLTSVQSRLSQVLDEQSSTGKALIEWYKEYGIALKDEYGQLRSTYDILHDVANIWPILTTNEKDYYLLQQAGANQTMGLSAILQNFNSALTATKEAYNSAGSAMKENEAFTESLESQTNKLSEAFQNFSTNILEKQFIEIAIKGSTKALNILSKDIGKFITQVGMLTSVGWGASSLVHVSKIVPTISTQFKNLAEIIGMVDKTGGLMNNTIVAGSLIFKNFSSVAFPVIGILSALSVAAYEVYKSWVEANPEIEKAKEELEGLSNQIKSGQDRLEEINNIPWYDRTDEILAEKTALEKENLELEKRLDTLKETIKVQSKKKLGQDVELTFGFESYTLSAEEYNEQLTEMMETYLGLIEESGTLSVEMQRQFNETKVAIAERAMLIRDSGKATEDLSVSEKALLETDERLNRIDSELAETKRRENEQKAKEAELTEALGKSLKINKEQYEKLLAINPDLVDSITELNEQYLIEGDVLNQLLVTSEEYVEGRITDDNILTKATMKNAELRLRALREEMSAIEEAGRTETDPNKLAQMEKIYGFKAEKASQIQGMLDKHIEALLGLTWNTGVSKKPTSKGSSSKSPEDLAMKSFQSAQKDLRHQLSMGLISYEDYYNKLEKLVAKYTSEATAHMKAYGLTSKQIEQNMYQYVEEIYNGRNKLLEESANKAIENQKKIAEAERNSLEEQKKAYEVFANIALDKINEKLKSYNDELDGINDKYDKQIENLKEANNETERSIELERLQEQLSKAKQSKLYVFKDGRYQYIQDADAISKAQADLEEFNREQRLEDEVNEINRHRDEEVKAVEDLIKIWESYRKNWEDISKDYNDSQDELLIKEKLGIDLEKENWDERINNLNDFVNEYNNILSKLDRATELSSSPDWSLLWSQTTDPALRKYFHEQKVKEMEGSGKKFDPVSGRWYGNGTVNANQGLSVVGEYGPELRVLNQGDGIIPADLTRNLWAWGAFDPVNLLQSVKSAGTNGNTSIVVENLNLPNVKDGNDFVDYMKNNFWQQTIKFSTMN